MILAGHVACGRFGFPHPANLPQMTAVAGKRLLIIGGSTRAAAWSAVRAGFQPVCADLFADLDTTEIAELVPVQDYPESLPDDVARVRADGWFYTGALENRHDLIERMQAPNTPYGSLWGAPASVLRLIRDPFWVHETLVRGGQPSPAVRPQSLPPDTSGQWMQKPLASAGGRAVSVWDRNSHIDEAVYYQQRLYGQTMSALYIRNGSNLQLLGMTRQLTDPVLTRCPGPFSYGGSIGPITPTATMAHRLKAAVDLLAKQCGLQGLFGVDFIRDDKDVPWIVEVNPRYTASVEILELALQRSLLLHCEHSPGLHSEHLPGLHSILTPAPSIAKMILYADRMLTAPDLRPLRHDHTPWEVPSLADIPIAGTVVQSGWPICTVLAAGHDNESCLSALRERAAAVWKLVD